MLPIGREIPLDGSIDGLPVAPYVVKQHLGAFVTFSI